MLVLDGDSPANTLAFTPDGTRLVVGRGDGHVEVWTVPGGERLHRWGPFGDFVALAVHPSGRFVFVGTEHSLTTVPLDGGRTVNGPPSAGQVIVSHSGAWVVAHEADGRHVVGLRCAPGGALRVEWQHELESTRLCRFVGTGNRFVTIDPDGLRVRAADTGDILSTVRYPSHYVLAWAVSPDGSRFGVMGYEKLYVWDTATWGKPVRFACAGGRRFGAMAFHPTRPLLATIQTGQTLVKFLDTETWKLAARFAWKLGEMRAVAFSPDGTLAAAGSVTGKIVIWDVDG